MATLTDLDARRRVPEGYSSKFVYITRDVWRIDQRIRQIKAKGKAGGEARVEILLKRRAELIAEYERLEKEGVLDG